MRNTLITTVSIFALSVYPIQGFAKEDLLKKELENAYMVNLEIAAHYLSILKGASTQVANHLQGTAFQVSQGTRKNNPNLQKLYIENIISDLQRSGQPPHRLSANALQNFEYDKFKSFKIAYRYCDGKLLTY